MLTATASSESRTGLGKRRCSGTGRESRCWLSEVSGQGSRLLPSESALQLLMSHQGHSSCPQGCLGLVSGLWRNEQNSRAGGDREQLSRADTEVSDASVTLGGDFPLDSPITPIWRLPPLPQPSPSPKWCSSSSHKMFLAMVKSEDSQALPFSTYKSRATKPKMGSKNSKQNPKNQFFIRLFNQQHF